MAVFNAFMNRRAVLKKSMFFRTLTMRRRQDGAVVGLLLAYLYLGVFLHRCGDVEVNPGSEFPIPGPPGEKVGNPRHTRSTLGGGSGGGSGAGRSPASSSSSEPTTAQEPHSLTDVISMLTNMNMQFANMDTKFNNMDSKFDDLMCDFREIKDSYANLKGEVEALSEEVCVLKEENDDLRDSNKQLRDSVKKLEEKTDELECRSKRNNIIVHGIPRFENETPEECESHVREMITDKLELGADFTFDRVHRINQKKDSPIIARCTYYKEKMAILKAKWKLKGSTQFVGEDFSLRVRNIRRKLAVHLQAAKAAKKRATMVFDHLLIEGKRYFLSDDESSIVEVF